MRLLYGASDDVLALLRKLYPQSEFRNAKAIGVLDGERLIGGVAFHDWNPIDGTVEFTPGGIGRWWTPDLAWASADYVFGALGCRALIGWTPTDNARARRLMELAGAEQHETALGKTLIILTQSAWEASKLGRRYGLKPESTNAA